MDWPVPKTLDIFVCQTSENKAFCNLFAESHPQFPRFPLGAPSTMTTVTTWDEIKFEFGESTGKLA